jgi:hypothetical protein
MASSYRYQRRLELQRQQMQEEEERERRAAQQRASALRTLPPEQHAALQSVYEHAVQPHLLHPSAYHLQRTVQSLQHQQRAAKAEFPGDGGASVGDVALAEPPLDPYVSMMRLQSEGLYELGATDTSIGEGVSPTHDAADLFSPGSSLASSPPDRHSYQTSINDVPNALLYTPIDDTAARGAPVVAADAAVALGQSAVLPQTLPLTASPAALLGAATSPRGGAARPGSAGGRGVRLPASSSAAAAAAAAAAARRLPEGVPSSVPGGPLDWTAAAGSLGSSVGAAASSVPVQFKMDQSALLLPTGLGSLDVKPHLTAEYVVCPRPLRSHVANAGSHAHTHTGSCGHRRGGGGGASHTTRSSGGGGTTLRTVSWSCR